MLGCLFRCVKKFRVLIIVLWVTLGGFLGYFAIDIYDYTVFTFSPNKGTESRAAYDEFNELFPTYLTRDTEIWYITCENCHENRTILTVKGVESLVKQINETIYSKLDDMGCLGLITGSGLGVTDYYSMFPPSAADMLVNLHSMIVIASWNFDNDICSQTKIQQYLVELKDFNWTPVQDIAVVMTGPSLLFKDSMDVQKKDMTTSDLYVLPLILLILAFMIDSWKLLIIQMLGIPLSAASSLGTFYFVARYSGIDCSPFAPAMMIFLCLAMSVDYGLFVLSRFSEERRQGRTVEESVRSSIIYSGHVVFLSGGVLVVSWMALVFMPINGFNTVGYGGALAILACMLVNTTFLPACILVCPKFFGTLTPMRNCFCCRICSQSGDDDDSVWGRSSTPDRWDVSPALDHERKVNDVSIAEPRVENLQNSLYWKLAQCTTKMPLNIFVPLLLFACMIPIILVLRSYEESLDNTIMFPRGTEASDAYTSVLADFGGGNFLPYEILVTGKQTKGSVLTDPHFLNATFNLGVAIYERFQDELFPKNITGLALFPTGTGFNQIPAQFYIDNTLPLVQEFYDDLTNPDHTATLVTIRANFDPFGNIAKKFIRDCRDVIHKVAADYPDYGFYLNSATAWELDSMEEAYKKFTWLFPITLVIIFAFISLRFGALFIPLKLFFTVVMPIAMVYGILCGVYQHGWLDHLGITSLKDTDGVYWMLPVMTATILVGFALDYEIFLFSRVWEYRRMGFPNREAISRGLTVTGPIISAAGIIMALAFGGMLLQNVWAMNQLGFIMVVGILCDTFIVRPILVPAILSLVDWINWWPTKMPSGLSQGYKEFD